LLIRNSQDAAISFYFTDAAGNDFGQEIVHFERESPDGRILNQAPLMARAHAGHLQFQFLVPVGVIAVRGFTMERSEFLITTFAGRGHQHRSTMRPCFRQFADGGGWTTQSF